MYHCSPIRDLVPEISIERSICLADDMDIAAAYLRGDAEHYLYGARCGRGAAIATESDLHEICKSIGVRIREGLEYEAVKKSQVRQAIVAAGFDGVRYGDTHEGASYTCTEFFVRPDGRSWSLVCLVEA